jgi:hypothetical protein
MEINEQATKRLWASSERIPSPIAPLARRKENIIINTTVRLRFRKFYKTSIASTN